MLYVGLDVSMRRTAVCVIEPSGKVVREVSVETAPDAIAKAIAAVGKGVERVGMEAGSSSPFLARELTALGLPVVVIDAAHASAALRTGFRNKTDRNDARGIADLMRVDKFRAVWVKRPAAVRDRALLTVREQLRGQSLDARNTIWAILQAEGLNPPRLSSPGFRVMLDERLEDPDLGPALRPLARVVEHVERQLVGDCQGSCARGHDDGSRRIIAWPSRRTSWTGCLRGATRTRCSPAAGCWTT